MATDIRLKHSATQDKVPLPTDLLDGEVALNTNANSPALYMKDNAGNIVKLAGAGAIGGTPATETAAGIAELATQAETNTGTDDQRIVTPLKLQTKLSATVVPATETAAGIAEIATQVETDAGTDDERIVTPLKMASYVATFAPVPPAASEAVAGIAELATQAETDAGTDDERIVTPLKLATKVASAGVGGTGSFGYWSRTGTVVEPVNAGDTVQISAGTEALPGLTPVGDPNTGIYSPGADQLALSINGTGRLFVDDQGAVKVQADQQGESVNTLFLGNKATPTGAGYNGTGNKINFLGSNLTQSVVDLSGFRSTNNHGFLHANAYTSQGQVTTRIVLQASDGGITDYNGNISFWTGNNSVTERARIDSSGRLLVGTSTSQGSYNLQCYGTGVWGQGAYVNGSDANIKQNIQDLEPALDVIKAMRPVTFQYKQEYSSDQTIQPGFIAQELQTAMAGKAYVDGVVQQGTTHLNVAYSSIIAVLVKAVQELEAKVAALEAL